MNGSVPGEDFFESHYVPHDLDAVTTGPASRFRIFSAEEIWADLPTPEYAIGGVLMKGNLGLLCAYGSSLKTWAEVDLLIAKACGGEWLGRFKCEKGRVLLVDWESGEYEARRRFQAVSRGRGIDGPVDGVELLTMPDLFMTSADFEAEVTTLALGRALICFDSLSAGSVDVDENDPRFAKGLQILKRVASATGCAFLVVHHSRKTQEGRTDDREQVRGSGAIFAACDVVLQLFRAEDGFTVRQTKARSGKAVESFLLRVKDTPNGGVAVSSYNEDEALESVVGGTIDASKRRILLLLGTSRDLRSTAEIARRVGGRKKTVLEAIAELEERNLIVRDGGVFRLASSGA